MLSGHIRSQQPIISLYYYTSGRKEAAYNLLPSYAVRPEGGQLTVPNEVSPWSAEPQWPLLYMKIRFSEISCYYGGFDFGGISHVKVGSKWSVIMVSWTSPPQNNKRMRGQRGQILLLLYYIICLQTASIAQWHKDGLEEVRCPLYIGNAPCSCEAASDGLDFRYTFIILFMWCHVRDPRRENGV